jgi:putative membrane protein
MLLDENSGTLSTRQPIVFQTRQAAYLAYPHSPLSGRKVGCMTAMTRNAVTAIGVLHLVFMFAEVFLWKPLVPWLHIYDKERTNATAAVGANMGIYNGILGALLIWVAANAPELGAGPSGVFSCCLLAGIIVAGIFGGLTIKWTIPIVQSLPALFVFAMVWGLI